MMRIADSKFYSFHQNSGYTDHTSAEEQCSPCYVVCRGRHIPSNNPNVLAAPRSSKALLSILRNEKRDRSPKIRSRQQVCHVPVLWLDFHFLC